VSIAEEVRLALIEAGIDVSGAPLVLTFTRENREAAWDPLDPETFTVEAMDSGIKKRAVPGSSEFISQRRILIPASVYVPRVGDKVLLDDHDHSVTAVEPTSPFGVPLMYKVYVAR
jgi:hypothetical protein